MKKLWSAFMQLDVNVRSYRIGLVLLFIGLTWSQLGCTVVGAVMVGESAIASYIVAWINTHPAQGAE